MSSSRQAVVVISIEGRGGGVGVGGRELFGGETVRSEGNGRELRAAMTETVKLQPAIIRWMYN